MRDWPVNGRVTAHSIERYRQWSGSAGSDDLVRHYIMEMFRVGEKMLPVYAATKLLNNDFEKCEYYCFCGLVAVWRDNAIVTVLPYHNYDFYPENGKPTLRTVPPIRFWVRYLDPKLARRIRRERTVRDKRKFIFSKIKRCAA